MSQQLYDKMLDSQEGVLYSLLDEMAEQFTREVVLAYTLMLMNKVGEFGACADCIGRTAARK